MAPNIASDLMEGGRLDTGQLSGGLSFMLVVLSAVSLGKSKKAKRQDQTTAYMSPHSSLWLGLSWLFRKYMPKRIRPIKTIRKKEPVKTWQWWRIPVSLGCIVCGKPKYNKKYCYWCGKRRGLW